MNCSFANFTLNSDERELRCNDAAVAIQPKTFDLLVLLLRERHRVVGREEIFEKVWLGETVSTTALNFNMNALRKVLGDDGNSQQFVRTYRGRGYRFVGEVTVAEESDAESNIAALSGPIFIGRDKELQLLESALNKTLEGRRGRLVLIRGEAGIGKTSVANALIAQAAAQNVPHFLGRCLEGSGAPPFLPWAQILGDYASQASDAELESALGSGARDLAALTPVITDRMPNLEPRLRDEEFARLRMFGAVSRALLKIAKPSGLLLVLDDLHWSDESSLLLLQSILRDTSGAPILVVATYRDFEVDANDTRAGILESLKRQPAFHEMALAGFASDEVRELLRQVAGEDIPSGFIDTLRAETRGNPFFILEVLRLLREEAGKDQRPWEGGLSPGHLAQAEGVRTVIGRRIARLSPPAKQTLELASVIGKRFGFGMLASLVGESDTLIDTLDEARQAQLVEQDANQPDSLQFSHALVREVLYADLGALRRAKLHRQVSQEMRRAARIQIASLSHHAYLGTLLGAATSDLEAAASSAVEAARDAANRLAFTEAAAEFSRALGIDERLHSEPSAGRIELFLELADAQSAAGDTIASQASAQVAASQAKAINRPDLLARAALCGSSGMVQRLVVSQETIAMLREGLAALASSDPDQQRLRSLLLARLALALYYSPESLPAERLALCGEAAALARESGDDEALYWALVAKHWDDLAPGRSQVRLERVGEMITIAERKQDQALLVRARSYRVGALLDAKEVDAAAREVETVRELVKATGSPLFRWTVRCFDATFALLRGDIESTRTYSDEAAVLGSEAGEESAALVFTSQLGARLLSQWRLAEFEPVMRDMIDELELPIARAVYALSACERGDKEAAAERFETYFANAPDGLREDNMWLATLTLLARIVCSIENPAVIERFYRRLTPWEGSLVTVGNASACLGSIDRSLGMLAMAMQRFEEAEVHFKAALELEETSNLKPWTAHTNYAYARLLAERSGPGDREKGLQLLERALETAEDIDAPALAAAIMAIRDPLLASASVSQTAGEKATALP